MQAVFHFSHEWQWRSQLIDCPGTVYITEIFPLYLKCCSFYHDHSILFAQEVCPGNQLAGYATDEWAYPVQINHFRFGTVATRLNKFCPLTDKLDAKMNSLTRTGIGLERNKAEPITIEE